MGVTIREVLDRTPRGCRVRFDHSGSLAEAEFAEPPDEARRRIGYPTNVEFHHDAVLRWRKLATLPAGAPGIAAAGPAATHIVGEVLYVTDVGEDVVERTFVYDLRLAKGTELFSVDSEELGDRTLTVGTVLEVTVEGLRLYPTNV